ncbi:MAG TPA: FecR family protein [Xanthobacteraceae bacterium]|nr:FecR family protein [Xanthobacteraceae bacterium]
MWCISWRPIVVAVTLFSCFACGQAAAQEAIGAISRIQGEASGTRGTTTQPLGANAPVYPNEVVSTGDGTRLEITFKDKTQLTLGEKVRLTLDTYIFNRTAGLGTIRFEVAGAFRFVSGRLSKLAKANVSVTTPVANIGIRGTDFWAGPIDNQALGVLLVNGRVIVSNAAGTQTLSRPGQGTNIAAPGAAPGPVTIWPQDKVNRALAAVTFR